MPSPKFAVIECEQQKRGGPWLVAWASDCNSIVAALRGYPHFEATARYDAVTGRVLEIGSDFKSLVGSPFSNKTVRSPDGTRLAVVLNTRCAVIDAVSLVELASFRELISDVAWSHDSKLLIGISQGTAHCWDVAAAVEIGFLKIKSAGDKARFAGFLPNNEEAIIGTDRSVIHWDIKSWTHDARVHFRNEPIRCQHGLSPDGQVLLSLSEDGTLYQTSNQTWETREFAAVKKVGDENFVFSSNGKLAAIGTSTGTLLVWDLEKEETWLKWSKKGFTGIRQILFSPDDTRLAFMLYGTPFVLDFREGAKSVSLREEELAARKARPNEPECWRMNGGEDRMDQKGIRIPLNPLPVKCEQCRFADLDFVPQPYWIGKGVNAPVDMAEAEVGNFFVREHVRKVLEVVAPGQVDFYPTTHVKTKEPTQWFLAVPKNQMDSGILKASVKRCSRCGEPATCHGTQYEEWPEIHNAPFDIFKMRSWYSSATKAPDFSQPYMADCVDYRHAVELSREFYFSVRLCALLIKELGYRGFYTPLLKDYELSQYDRAWLKEMRVRLQSAGLGPATSIEDVAPWFESYLKAKAKKKPKTFDFLAIETKHGLQLPTSYKDFISKVGPKKFRNVDDQEGFTVEILPPNELGFDFKKYSEPETEEAEGEGIEPVVFAATEHGDLLCFDVKNKNTDYPVYLYEHEMDDFEPYANNFAACVKRLAGK